MSALFLTRSASLFETGRHLFGAILLVSFSVLLLYFTGFDAVAALRDGVLSDQPEAGLISNVGILLMGVSALFALVLGLYGRSVPVFALGAFCGVFAIDDALLLHEKLGSLEILLFLCYGISLLTVLLSFTRGNDGHLVWPIVLALAAFAASVAVDVTWEPMLELFDLKQSSWPLSRIGFCLEDIPKFGGLVLLSSFAIGEGLAVRRKAP